MITANHWRYSLIAIGSASSLIYPHVPLVSFAAVAGVTLRRRQAVASALLIWLFNQFYGFIIRDYPLTAISLAWGVTMGLGTVAVALITSMQPKFSYRSWIGQGVWLSMALLLGFIAYQSSILLVNQWVGMHGLTADLFLRILGREVIWAIALFGLYTALTLNHQRLLRRTSR